MSSYGVKQFSKDLPDDAYESEDVAWKTPATAVAMDHAPERVNKE